jgi:hypothetical protein
MKKRTYVALATLLLTQISHLTFTLRVSQSGENRKIGAWMYNPIENIEQFPPSHEQFAYVFQNLLNSNTPPNRINAQLQSLYQQNPSYFGQQMLNTAYQLSPLQYAIFYKQPLSVVLQLLEFPEVKNTISSLKDQNGRAAIYMAIDTHNIDVVNLLLKNGANVNTHDKHGITPLQAAENASILIETIKTALNENQNQNPKNNKILNKN